MSVFINIGIFVIIIGVLVCFLAIWAVITHREKKYNNILNEHIQQTDRVKKKLIREEDKKNED